MKNVYKGLIETIPIALGVIILSHFLGNDIILYATLFWAMWGKAYQYWTEKENKKDGA